MPSYSAGAAPTFTTNANELTAKLNRIGDKLEDPREPLEACRRLLVRQEAEVWSSQGQALGYAWPPIAEPERKVDSRMLVATSALLYSMAEEGAGTIRGGTLRIRPKPRYGFYHQFGLGHVPARPFSGISDNTYRLMMQAFERATGEVLGA